MGDRLIGAMAGVWLATLFAGVPAAWILTRWFHWRNSVRRQLLE